MKSQKEIILNKKLLKMLSNKAYKTVELLINDKEIHYLQDYANTVSIKRLHFNDHGPVHMRKVTINALKMIDLLHNAGIKMNLELEGCGTFEDSKIAVIIAAFLHDIGMSVGRSNHENSSVIIATPIIDRILSQLYENNIEKRVILRSIIIEGIVGHMATQRIHSLEAGLILIADGCDMEKGRARIPMMIDTDSKVGDIHKYSASAIESVKIEKGDKRPIKITINMTESAGFYQIEEVLFRKINSSPVKSLIELYASIIDGETKCYL